MPSSNTSSHVFAMTFSSCRTPTLEKMGRMWAELAVGVELCAATQIEQEAASVAVG